MAGIIDIHGDNVVPMKKHTDALIELANALTLLEPCGNALAAGRELLKKMLDAGAINDDKHQLAQYIDRTGGLLVNIDKFLAKWKRLAEEQAKQEIKLASEGGK